MPRVKRYFDSGLIWHIPHRCYKKEFLSISPGIKKESGYKSRGRRFEKERISLVLREEHLGFLTNLILPPKKHSKT